MNAACPTVRIGDIGFREHPCGELPLPYRAFVDDGETDVEIEVSGRHLEGTEDLQPLFDAPPNWSLARCNGSLLFRTMFSDALWNRRQGTISLHPRDGAASGGISFFSYPLAELITLSLLAERGGLLLHACGVMDGGRVLLFAGPSGAGKSTMANLWRGRGYAIPSDDRIILRLDGQRVVAQGTPWHGDAGTARNASAPAAALFFLRHGFGHRIAPLPIAEAAAEILRNSFSPYWSRTDMKRVLATLEVMSGQLRCFRLDFTTAADIVDTVLKALP